MYKSSPFKPCSCAICRFDGPFKSRWQFILYGRFSSSRQPCQVPKNMQTVHLFLVIGLCSWVFQEFGKRYKKEYQQHQDKQLVLKRKLLSGQKVLGLKELLLKLMEEIFQGVGELPKNQFIIRLKRILGLKNANIFILAQLL